MPQSFVGAGWSFPLHTDSTGSIALSTGDKEIVEAMRLILGTSFGERPMRPEFGCGIHDRVFDNTSSETFAAIKRDVESSLNRWEPRINVLEVRVTPGEVGTSLLTVLYVDVRYELKGTNDRRNLVFPFYLIPEHEE
jgi:phage baseplate assembly protein W